MPAVVAVSGQRLANVQDQAGVCVDELCRFAGCRQFFDGAATLRSWVGTRVPSTMTTSPALGWRQVRTRARSGLCRSMIRWAAAGETQNSGASWRIVRLVSMSPR
ncbi:hypothetical protein GCM10010442_77960 [Kitasatospora kifunensis]